MPVYLGNTQLLANKFQIGALEAKAYLGSTLVYPPSAALWTPAEIATSFWLDASDASQFTLSGTTITAITDKSTSNRTVITPVTSTTSLESGYITQVPGAGSSINDYIQVPDAFPLGSAGKHTFVVGQKKSGAPADSFVVSQYMLPPVTGALLRLTTEPAARYNSVVIPYSAPSVALDADTIYAYSYNTNSEVRFATLRINGSNRTTSSSAANLTNSNSTILILLGFLAGSTTLNPTNDWAREVIIILDDAVAAANTEKIEGYLAHKWGLTASLPIDHPYKTAAPTV